MDCYVDTSAFYAYLVAKDRYHGAVVEILQGFIRDGRTRGQRIE